MLYKEFSTYFNWVSNYIQTAQGPANLKYEFVTVMAVCFITTLSSNLGSGNLGGGIKPDDTLLLMVDSPRSTYLKGAVKDYYTGSSWICTDKQLNPLSSKYNAFNFDSFELLTASKILSGDPDFIEKYFYKDNIKITYQNIKTKSLFYPLKSVNISPGSGNQANIYTTGDGSLLTDTLLERGFEYSIDVYSIKYSDSTLANILRQSRKGLYNSIRRSLRRQFVPNFRILRENAQRIYSKYLQLPENLPDRVRKLADTLTADAPTNYDKVKAVEKYLSSNYTYTLSPAPTPESTDFVDYFLFELKHGYCTYYASAIAVLVTNYARMCMRINRLHKMPSKECSLGLYGLYLKL